MADLNYTICTCRYFLGITISVIADKDKWRKLFTISLVILIFCKHEHSFPHLAITHYLFNIVLIFLAMNWLEIRNEFSLLPQCISANLSNEIWNVGEFVEEINGCLSKYLKCYHWFSKTINTSIISLC